MGLGCARAVQLAATRSLSDSEKTRLIVLSHLGCSYTYRVGHQIDCSLRANLSPPEDRINYSSPPSSASLPYVREKYYYYALVAESVLEVTMDTSGTLI